MPCAPWTDDVWRDYCVQFLGKCYPAVADMDSRRSMAAALWEALETRRASSCAGAAGRQLMSLSRSFREFPPGDVSRAALEALRAPECSDGSRCALLQVYAVLGDAAALPDALAPPSPGFGRRRTPTREKHLRLSPKSANSGYCSASAPDIIHRQKE